MIKIFKIKYYLYTFWRFECSMKIKGVNLNLKKSLIKFTIDSIHSLGTFPRVQHS